MKAIEYLYRFASFVLAPRSQTKQPPHHIYVLLLRLLVNSSLERLGGDFVTKYDTLEMVSWIPHLNEFWLAIEVTQLSHWWFQCLFEPVGVRQKMMKTPPAQTPDPPPEIVQASRHRKRFQQSNPELTKQPHQANICLQAEFEKERLVNLAAVCFYLYIYLCCIFTKYELECAWMCLILYLDCMNDCIIVSVRCTCTVM